jgi:RHS repeat-associated protein
MTGQSQPFFSQSRTYDSIGNVLTLDTVIPAQSGGTLTDNQSYCYDDLSRLVWNGNTGTPSGGDDCGPAPSGTTVSANQQAYRYDSLDRITSGQGGTTYSYGDPNHVHAVTGLSSIPEQYAAYDAMGNMTCRNTATGTGHTCAGSTPTGATMTYDSKGQLASWTAQQNQTASDSFLYDAQGNRVLQHSSSTVSGVTTVTDIITFDGYTETTLSGGTTTTLTYDSLGGQRLAMQKNSNQVIYLVNDLLGSTDVAIKSSDTIVAVQLYWPYGDGEYSWGTMPTTYNFTGQRLDSVTGLLYFNARYYDPESGRFTQADTVETNADGMDPFAYVGDSPMGKTDPSGHCFPFCLVTAIVGAAVGAAVGIIAEAAQHGTNFSQYNWGHVAVDAAVGGVAGFLIGTGVGAAVGVGMIAGGGSALIGSVASHKSFADVVQSTFEGAAVGGIIGGLTDGIGSQFGLADRVMFSGNTLAGVGRALGQGVIQGFGGIAGDTATQAWDSWRTGGQVQINEGEVFTAGGISFAGGFLGQWAYNNWKSPAWITPSTTSRVARGLDRDMNWFMQDIWGNSLSGFTQVVVQGLRSSSSNSDGNDWIPHSGYAP